MMVLVLLKVLTSIVAVIVSLREDSNLAGGIRPDVGGPGLVADDEVLIDGDPCFLGGSVGAIKDAKLFHSVNRVVPLSI